MKSEVRRAKLTYKEKVEDKLSSKNPGSAWDVMKTMTGLHDSKCRTKVVLDGFDDKTLADELNRFYLRFDVNDFSKECAFLKADLSNSSPVTAFDERMVVNTFKHCKRKTSPGPDNIGGRLLSCCAEQLGPIFCHIFMLSLVQQRVPKTWKQSIVVPIAKTTHPKAPNDYRPVALTSLVMRSFEKLIKHELLVRTEHLLDPVQFAYRMGRGVQDATITLLDLLTKHLEGNKAHAKLLFVDFASAFNTIQPHLLVDRLCSNFGVDSNMAGWILDFLSGRSQRVRVNGCVSGVLSSSTGSPQGCVLSPLLYILYTDDCRSQFPNRYILKFADDTVIVSLLRDAESSHGPVLDYFLKWCKNSFLSLNVTKTKDMCIDFRRHVPATGSTVIDGQEVESVLRYKYLGSIIDNKLAFGVNTDRICKKSQQRLFCLRKLATFGIDKTLMTLFYKSYIESVLIFSCICWFGGLNVTHKNALNRVVNIGSKIIGAQQNNLSVLYNRQVVKKANSILSDHSHPLHQHFQLLPSGTRFSFPLVRTNRYKYSFTPTAITLLNAGKMR